MYKVFCCLLRGACVLFHGLFLCACVLFLRIVCLVFACLLVCSVFTLFVLAAYVCCYPQFSPRCDLFYLFFWLSLCLFLLLFVMCLVALVMFVLIGVLVFVVVLFVFVAFFCTSTPHFLFCACAFMSCCLHIVLVVCCLTLRGCFLVLLSFNLLYVPDLSLIHCFCYGARGL